MWGAVIGAGASVVGSLLGGASSAQQYANQKAAYKYQKKLQEYHNKMVNISAGIQQNAITTNVTNAIQQSAQIAQDLQKRAQQVTGATEVAAAATGTTGRSVDLAKLDVQRQAAGNEYARQQQLQNVFDNADAQRLQIETQAVMQQDLSWNSAPTQSNSTAMGLISGALDLGSSLLDAGVFDNMFKSSSTGSTQSGTINTYGYKNPITTGFLSGLVK